MKRILSFFTLLAFLVIAFFHNTMMSFALQDNMQDDMMMQMGINNMNYYCNDKDDRGRDNNCCYESEDGINVTTLNNSHENNKKLKIKVKSYIDIFALTFNSFGSSKLVRKTSPPNSLRIIKNYSYKDLIKIVKSNT